MKKRRILIAAVLVIGLALLASGALAYFVAEGTATSTVTTGGVSIRVSAWGDEARTVAIPTEGVHGILPGTSVTEIVEVTGEEGSAPAWLRVRVEKSITLADDVEGEPDLDLVVLDGLNTDAWTDGGDGWYYYNTALTAGETTEALFTAVRFAPAMGNEYQGAEARVAVSAQAVQTAHNGNSALEAAGWPA